MQVGLKKFEELTPFELYDLLRLRSQVFVVEQQCVFLDMDNLDQASLHLTGSVEGQLKVYMRLLPPGLAYDGYCSIGRVVNSSDVRGSGLGKQLLQRAITLCHELFADAPIKIGAQAYLQKYYEAFGFVQCGPHYDEDGIDHLPMIHQQK